MKKGMIKTLALLGLLLFPLCSAATFALAEETTGATEPLETPIETPAVTIYQVTFDTDGGNEHIMPVDVEEGTTVKMPEDPTKDNRIFIGWYTAAGVKFDPATKIMGNTDLIARWVDKDHEFKIDFELNGGEGEKSKNVLVNKTIADQPDPTRKNHRFDGWYTDSGLSMKYDVTQPVLGDLTLYAKWVEQIKIVSVTKGTDGTWSTSDEPITVDKGTEYKDVPIIRPSSQILGFEFDGDYWDKEFKTSIKLTDAFDKDTEIYSYWRRVGYVLTFNVNGGKEDSYAPQVLKENELIKVADPTREGYVFDGWYNGDVKWDMRVGMPANDMMLTAHWKKIHTITFDLNGGTGNAPTKQLTVGQVLTKPDDPTREGYDFLGWYLGDEKWDFRKGILDQDMHLVAKWQAKSAGTTANTDNPTTLKKNLPNTGSQRNTLLMIAGVCILVIVIVIVWVRRKKDSK
ncbi:hypothetical protein NRIC_28020 [Enterococcus florum]|uniref:Gram-positive cocci surface proteins LPxTG domain-containing protein n=1 Tax=Enterococcus florum TaxID=2480627 RepID=A0A4P5PEX8_9ENTE|nr:InlB B-repeat-containing protein [Enterococcus florum]GCF94911.1 hypothetical protein NRIC_28020 [Enterococcus florum]